MPNIKSAKKRVLLSREANVKNKMAKSALKTTLKKFDSAVVAGNREEATAAYKAAVVAVDKAAVKGILHKNNAARKKSSMTLKLEADMEEARLETLLTGEYDANNALLSFHAGAGGTEAQDWCAMLYRMYTRWAEAHGFTYKILDYLDGDEAGLKSADIMIEGDNAYGFLKGEAGVHRLVRVSPFDAAGRRHTSFSAVEVIPEIPDDVEVEIRPEDIEMQVYRSSGAGGQHINKTSSAVRLIHKPTGIVVSCQTQRDQFQNKETCMRMLRSKLIEIKEREHLEKISDIKGVQQKIEWGSQIRSYVFMPYTLVKDTRTGFESTNVNAVMDGDLDGFINAYLTCAATGTWATK